MTVSTLNQYRQLLFNSNQLRERQVLLQQQTSSGYKAQVLSGLGQDALRSVTLRDNLTEIDTFQRNIAQVRTRTGIMDTVMVRATEIARKVEKELIRMDGVSRADPAIIREMARQALQDIGQLLNTTVNGRHVFGGSSLQTPPVNVDNRIADFAENEFATNFPGNPTALVENIFGEVFRPDRSLTPPNGGNPEGIFNSALAEGDFPVEARVDQGFDVKYGIKADAEPFRRIMFGLAVAAGLREADPADETSLRDIARQARTALTEGAQQLDREIGVLGSIRSRVDLISRKHDNVETLLRGALGEVEDTDMAAAATELRLIEAQIQATYSLIANQRRLSLVDFLT